VTTRTALISIGAIFWISALGCWLRARGRGRRAGEAVLFIALGLPFLVAGAFYTSSNYPGYVPPATRPPVTPAATVQATPAMTADAHAQAVLAAQRAAVARYPALGVAGSAFNRAFVEAYHRLRHTEPYYFDDAQWPLLLADETARDLAARSQQ
jgi:hypothetical protein